MTKALSPTSTECYLAPDSTPGYIHAPNLTQSSANKVSELLNTNHASYHTRWKGTFHNHLVHHLIGLWALGATPDELDNMWNFNTPYQTARDNTRLQNDSTPEIDLDLRDPEQFSQSLGKDECYADFLKYFEEEIAKKGMQHVVHEYIFKGDERADDVFYRMFTDLVHPIIHLGCGLEFNQPALVAEALAGACVHDNWPGIFLQPTEKAVRAQREHIDSGESTQLALISRLRNDTIIANGVKDTDPFNKVPDGLLKRVGPEHLVPHLSQFTVRPTPADIHSKTREMMRTCAYVLGAAQRPGKEERVDFVFLHAVTLAAFFPAIAALDWLPDGDKARLLEAKVRVDAVLYAGCGCPELYPSRIREYRPRRPADGWPELFHRAVVYQDEGHIVKAIRSLFGVDQMERDGEGSGDGDGAEELPIGRDDYKKIAHMVVDSVERALEPGGNWMPEAASDAVEKQLGVGGDMVTGNMKRFVFYGGLPKAWDFVPDLKAA